MEVRQVRTEEVKLQKEDQPAPNIRYYGRSANIGASDSEEVWQILREYRVGNITTIEYANKGSFTCRWDQRASLFGPATPDPSSPVIGTVTIQGLNTAGRVTIVTVNDTTWTALPFGPSALPNRNAMSIQNQSPSEVKLNYDNTVVGYDGVIIPSSGERQYDIKPGIAQYIKASPGSGTTSIAVEEIA